MDKLIIGLTGLIGSGKSLVAQMLEGHGAFIIDTDTIAHELTTSSEIVNQLVQLFGINILKTTGELDRVKLRKLVFEHDNLRLKLENLLHPRIFFRVREILQKTDRKYIVIVVPLLFKAKKYISLINRSLFIDCSQDLLIRRVMQRNNLLKEEVIKILSTQVEREIQLQLATDVVLNDGTIEQLKNQVTQLHNKYCILLNDMGKYVK